MVFLYTVIRVSRFNVRTLLDKIPGQTITFDNLYPKGNSFKYHDMSDFTKNNFDTASSFGVMRNNIVSIQKHHDALCILFENLQYSLQVIGITEMGFKLGIS